MISRANSGRRAHTATREPPSARVFANVGPHDPAPITATCGTPTIGSCIVLTSSPGVTRSFWQARGFWQAERMARPTGRDATAQAHRFASEFFGGFTTLFRGFGWWKRRPDLMLLGLLPALIVAAG